MWENIIQSIRKVKSGDKGLGCILAHTMGLGLEDHDFQKLGELDRGRLKLLKFGAQNGWVLSYDFANVKRTFKHMGVLVGSQTRLEGIP
ncbi:hypothetical protein E5676_scaffold429G00040 [Cucumis melo var. makuwa]|uniref:Uncharacterized protein n=1 Tax=Cucumis melo var. makuwa TaxID=1194695 RepID=A0A5D3BKE8_CUCMM|nr:hypothetical protein E5676_scaffold429G00040 [Cucumis melo var. makuwa]